MVVLWVVNNALPEAEFLLSGRKTEIKTTGGWVYGYASALLEHQAVDLHIASIHFGVRELTVLKGERITYYLVPCPKGSLVYDRDQEEIWRRIGGMVNPDVVHIHGTEFAHSLASFRVFDPEKTVVSIQGLKSAYWEYYTQGFTPSELRRGWTVRDLLKGNMRHEQKLFRKSGELEAELLRECRHVIGRTSWDRARVWALNPSARYHFCNEVLRPEFYDGRRWDYERCSRHTIFLSQAEYAIKGLHQVHVVGDGEVGHHGLTEALDLHVAGIVGTQRHGVVDDLGNDQHPLVELGVQLVLQLLQVGQTLGVLGHFLLHGLGFGQLGGVLLGLAHQHADLLGQGIAGGAELVGLHDGGTALGVQLNDLIHQGQLFVLELLFDVLLDDVGIFPDKFDV